MTRSRLVRSASSAALAAAAVAALSVHVPAAQAASASATPSAGPSASPSPDCPEYTLETSDRVIPVGGEFTLRVQTQPGTRIQVARRTPAPSQVVRAVEESATGTESWTFRLGESHVLDVRVGSLCGRPDEPVAVDVHPYVSISAIRNTVRDYTFSGRVVPARQQRVSLWRVEADGRRVLTALSTVGPDGGYRIDRRFTGSGRFGFQVDVAATSANLGGRSAVRPTVIH